MKAKFDLLKISCSESAVPVFITFARWFGGQLPLNYDEWDDWDLAFLPGSRRVFRHLDIKISIPYQFDVADVSQFTGNQLGEIDGCRISVADSNVREADAWFVIEDLTPNDLSCIVPTGQVHFLSSETAYSCDKYMSNHKKSFLRQFDRIYTFYPTKNRRARFAPPFLPWMVNANHGTVFRPHFRDLSFFSGLDSLPKTQRLSMICSVQVWRPEHKRRLAFAKAAKAHFGDELSWFGNGINQIEEKWEGLASFERTIVLENTLQEGVFSEKILDPYLALCQPIYSGAPDISDYFPVDVGQVLDLSDFDMSINKISKLLDNDVSDRERELIELGKQAVLNQHHFLRRICRIAKQTASSKFVANKRRHRVLKQSSVFLTEG